MIYNELDIDDTTHLKGIQHLKLVQARLVEQPSSSYPSSISYSPSLAQLLHSMS